MKTLKIEQQQRMYDVLKKISRAYMTPAQIARDAQRSHGALSKLEYLEMAYENIQAEAKRAIKGLQRPAAAPESPADERDRRGRAEERRT